MYVPREVQLERLMSRDQMTLADAEARIAAQMDIERKKERANIVIDNSGSWAQTEKQLQAFLTRKGLL
ncbi:Dephospho-CoA kinase [compost metagenome]